MEQKAKKQCQVEKAALLLEHSTFALMRQQKVVRNYGILHIDLSRFGMKWSKRLQGYRASDNEWMQLFDMEFEEVLGPLRNNYIIWVPSRIRAFQRPHRDGLEAEWNLDATGEHGLLIIVHS